LPVRGATAAANDVGVICRACLTLALKRLKCYYKKLKTIHRYNNNKQKI